MSNYKDVQVQTLTPIRHWLAVECTGGQGAFKNWKHRYFVLQDVFLYYYQKPTDKKPKGVVNIEGATVTVCSCTTLRCGMASLTPAKHAANVQMKDNLFKDKPPVIELITNKRKVAACLPIENTSVDSQCQPPTQMVYTHTRRDSSFTMQKQAMTLSCGFTSSRLQLTGLVDLQSSRNGACSLWHLLCVRVCTASCSRLHARLLKQRQSGRSQGRTGRAGTSRGAGASAQGATGEDRSP